MSDDGPEKGIEEAVLEILDKHLGPFAWWYWQSTTRDLAERIKRYGARAYACGHEDALDGCELGFQDVAAAAFVGDER